LYCDHVVGNGEGLFHLACENDLEGVVAKHQGAPYLPDPNTRLSTTSTVELPCPGSPAARVLS
jgi:hypothetical protein